VLAFTYRTCESGLGCGQPARPHSTERRGPAAQGPSCAGHCPERDVHSLWIRLLIRMWGAQGE